MFCKKQLMSDMSKMRIHVIACGVLAVDLKHLIGELDLDIKVTYLSGGLHRSPKELRRRLQAAIDEVSAAGEVDQIAIGYGVCGRGAVGIQARQVPLVFPRVHDCIALFLGSDAAYQRQFSQYSGTYYISAGWVKEKVQPHSAQADSAAPPVGPPVTPPVVPPSAFTPLTSGASAPPIPPGDGQEPCQCADPELARLVAQHGAENAQAIQHFLTSWQRNYQRAAFIDTGAAEHLGIAAVAKDMAARYGWKYEELAGNLDLLRKVLRCRVSDKEVLWVPPHHVTVYDPIARGLDAAPVWEIERQGAKVRDQVIEISTEGTAADDLPHPGTPREDNPARLGLGIDAGGTYTDVVIYEFGTNRVLQKAKALTTKWDYTLGIFEALDRLDASRLAQVDLVCISTTLATNAIVEGRGQKVGLLIMPPYGLFNDTDITHRPIAIIKGRLEITGTELSPIDPEEVRRVARRMVTEEKVGALAVAGYASHANPVHEAEVRRLIEAETGLPVTCGYDVSEQLDYTVRAQTAALNGRIIPILVSFLEQADHSLRQRGITAPIMVVRSDGALMSVGVARQRPIETILSGPAASVAGARFLAQVPTAFVVDVGGTTTDTALIVEGEVRTARRGGGACVGGWQTHVQSLDLRTCGLGGDSLIAYRHHQFHIGPRRVGPVSWLAARQPQLDETFGWIEQHLADYSSMPALLDIYFLNGRPDGTLTARERRFVEALAQRPHSGHELATRFQQHWWENFDIERLERQHLLVRCGLTPTDLLHVSGQFQRWDTAAAGRMTALFSRAIEVDESTLLKRVTDLFVRRLALEIFKKQLDEQVDGNELERSELCRALMDNWMGGGVSGIPGVPASNYHVRVRLEQPIIGIGAPVSYFLPAAAKLLETSAIIPEHADVANAIGAITSSVVIRRRAEVCPDMNGRYAVHGIPGAPTFTELAEARAAAIEVLRGMVAAAAGAAGTSQSRIQIVIHDNVAPLAEGGQVFIAQTIEARLTGRPDLQRSVVGE